MKKEIHKLAVYSFEKPDDINSSFECYPQAPSPNPTMHRVLENGAIVVELLVWA